MTRFLRNSFLLSLGLFLQCSSLLANAQKSPLPHAKLSSAQQRKADARLVALWKTRDDAPDIAPQLTYTAVQASLNAGADANARDRAGQTALIAAVSFLHRETDEVAMVRLLLAHSADVNAKRNDGVTALMLADSPAVVRLLLSHGADVNAKTHIQFRNGLTAQNGATPLMSARDPEIIKLLLAHGADVNAKDADGDTALLNAVMDDNAKWVNLLLAHGADINAKNNQGESVLMRAALWGNTDLVRLLVAHGADVNARDHQGGTALIIGQYGGSSDPKDKTTIVKILLDKGAAINAKDNDGKTALMIAAGDTSQYDLNAIRLLLARGADINAKDHEGETALSIAVRQHRTAIVKLLESAGAK